MTSQPLNSALSTERFTSPDWYQLQTSQGGHQFVKLPSQPDRPSVFLTTFYSTDAEILQAVLDIPSLNNQLIAVPRPYTLRDAKFWIDLQLSGKSALPLQALRINDPDSGTFIGAVSLMPSKAYESPLHNVMEYHADDHVLGYYLHPDFWRQGIMRNAVMAELAWGVEEKGILKVVASASGTNTASKKLIESLPGFKQDCDAEIEWLDMKGGGTQKILTWRFAYYHDRI